MAEAVNPYAAPKAALEDVQHDAPDYASRWQRLGGSIIDSVILFATVMLGFMMASQSHNVAATSGVLVVIGALVVSGINLRLLYLHGATLGKRAVKIRIVRADGTRASLARLVFLRGLPQWIVSVIPYVNLLGFVDILFIFGNERRCLHDYVADTIVIKG